MSKTVNIVLPVVLLSLTLAGAAPAFAASSPIEARRQKLSDTDFVSWLDETDFDSRVLRLRKWKLLTSSERLKRRRRLGYYRQWTEATGSINRPHDQLRLAVLAGRDVLTRKWLLDWLDSDSVDRRKLTDVIDLLLDNGKFQLVEKAVSRARDIFDRSQLYYRRLAASLYARGRHRRSVEEYLKVARKRSLRPRIKHRLRLAVNQGNLHEYLIERVADRGQQMDRPRRFISMAVDFITESEEPAPLLAQLLELSGDTDFIASQFDAIRSQFLELDRPRLAARVHRRLIELTGAGAGDLLTEAKIYLKLEKSDSALASLASLRTTDTEAVDWREADRLRLRAYLLASNYDSAAARLDSYSSDEMVPDRIELLSARNNYRELAELVAGRREDFPWVDFYSSYMLGEVDTAALNRLVEAEPDRSETALALALASLKDGEVAREFLRWLDQFRLDQTIELVPPEKFYGEKRQLPKVLVDRWYSNFEPGRRPAKELVELGRSLSFPPLILAGAKRQLEQSATDRARDVLEKILINYPETYYRPVVEKLLTELE